MPPEAVKVSTREAMMGEGTQSGLRAVRLTGLEKDAERRKRKEQDPKREQNKSDWNKVSI